MGRHDAIQPRRQCRKRTQVRLLNLIHGARVYRQLQMGICYHMAMTREVLSGRGHTGSIHAINKRPGQRYHRLRITMKTAIADHRAGPIIQIQHRRKTDIDIQLGQFGRHQLADKFGILQRLLRPARVTPPQCSHGRQAHKAFPKTLHPAPFLIDSDQHVWADFANLAHQLSQLLPVLIIAGK